MIFTKGVISTSSSLNPNYVRFWVDKSTTTFAVFDSGLFAFNSPITQPLLGHVLYTDIFSIP